MTLFTTYRAMHAKQRKFGDIVIEGYFFTPTLLIVTAFTIRTFLPFMHIILLVTDETLRLELFFV